MIYPRIELTALKLVGYPLGNINDRFDISLFYRPLAEHLFNGTFKISLALGNVGERLHFFKLCLRYI